jgi:hypothetical protein
VGRVDRSLVRCSRTVFVRVAPLEHKAVQLGIVHQNCFSARGSVPDTLARDIGTGLIFTLAARSWIMGVEKGGSLS